MRDQGLICQPSFHRLRCHPDAGRQLTGAQPSIAHSAAKSSVQEVPRDIWAFYDATAEPVSLSPLWPLISPERAATSVRTSTFPSGADMPAAARTERRYGVVPMPPQHGTPLLDLWGVADRHNGSHPVQQPDGKPVIFYSFADAARWAADHE
ncbi:hypothetical protein GCM10023235_41170 [Kitasatospora terrestris]|uniref:Uncharacterized protein n=1 Tax=Kitasatospora terrestris TaxID=258051 RepID=A0ABP9DSX6_9ACTN